MKLSHQVFGAFCVLAILAVSSVNSGVRAEDGFVATNDIGSSVIDFDTLEGKYSSWSISDVGTLNAIRTTMRVHRIGYDRKWSPVLAIGFKNGEDVVWFRLHSLDHNTPLGISLQRHRANKKEEEKNLAKKLDLHEDLPVAINWDRDGTVTVQVKDESPVALSLGKPILSVELLGSTCEGEFAPFRIGRSATASH